MRTPRQPRRSPRAPLPRARLRCSRELVGTLHEQGVLGICFTRRRQSSGPWVLSTHRGRRIPSTRVGTQCAAWRSWLMWPAMRVLGLVAGIAFINLHRAVVSRVRRHLGVVNASGSSQRHPSAPSSRSTAGCPSCRSFVGAFFGYAVGHCNKQPPEESTNGGSGRQFEVQCRPQPPRAGEVTLQELAL